MKKVNLFTRLFKNDVVFAVCVAVNSFKIAGVENNSKDYYVIIHDKYFELFKDRRISRSNDYYNVWEIDLTYAEIEHFKNTQNDYVKVQHDVNGRVYELKNKSFKENFKNELGKKNKRNK